MCEMCERGAGLLPGWGRSPGVGNRNPLLYSWPGESHEQRSLVGYSPWGLKESDTTERLSAHTLLPLHLVPQDNVILFPNYGASSQAGQTTHTYTLPESEVGTQISALDFLNLCALCTPLHLFSVVRFATFQITAPHLCLCRTVGSSYCEQSVTTTHVSNYFLWHRQENISISIMSLTLKQQWWC